MSWRESRGSIVAPGADCSYRHDPARCRETVPAVPSSGREAAVPSGSDTCEQQKVRKQRAYNLSTDNQSTVPPVTVGVDQR